MKHGSYGQKKVARFFMDHGVLVLVVVVEVAAATAVEHGSFCSWMSAEVGCGVRVLRLVIDRAYVS